MNTTSYFLHNHNARNDVKLLRLRADLGLRGYAVYFMLLEKIGETNDNTCDADYSALSYDFRCDEELIKQVVENYNLFQIKEDPETGDKRFFSVSYNDRKGAEEAKSSDISNKRRKAASVRWEKAANSEGKNMQNDAKYMQNDAKSNLHNLHDAKRKEKQEEEENPPHTPSKEEKEIKEKEKSREKTSFSLSVGDPQNCVSPPAPTGAEKERENFLKYLVLRRRLRAPADELQRFYDHYSSQGWCKAGGVKVTDRKALLRAWKIQKDYQPIDDRELQYWVQVLRRAEKYGTTGRVIEDVAVIRSLTPDKAEIIFTDLGKQRFDRDIKNEGRSPVLDTVGNGRQVDFL